MQSLRETLHCHYRYDALDRLIANERPSEPERQRFYCKSRLATEIQGANRYSMFQHGDQLLAQQQREGDVLDATLLATDQQRSVLHALKGNQPRQSIAYSPYGHRPAENGLLSLLGFNGERPDPVTGHYLLGNGYRAFNPVLMRFNSPDSWSPFGKGGLNPYAYCLNDPVNRRDPNAHVSFKAVGILLRSIYRMKRQTAPLKRTITSKAADSSVFHGSRDNGFSTIRYGSEPPNETINAPTLQQLSFSAATGNELQTLANKSIGHSQLIKDLDLSIGDINLDNFTWKTYRRNFEKSSENLSSRIEKRTNSFNAINSALAGEIPGILPSRAKLREIRDFSDDPEIPIFKTTNERRYL
jgi:RHS repeat-associated protein